MVSVRGYSICQGYQILLGHLRGYGLVLILLNVNLFRTPNPTEETKPKPNIVLILAVEWLYSSLTNPKSSILLNIVR